MKDSDRYVKIVEWSEEDQAYVGSAPGLIYGGCHGADEREVFNELCIIVDEAIELYRRDGKPLPPVTSGRDLANRIGPRLGRRVDAQVRETSRKSRHVTVELEDLPVDEAPDLVDAIAEDEAAILDRDEGVFFGEEIAVEVDDHCGFGLVVV